MERNLLPPSVLGVEAFEQQCLVSAHPRHVEPSMRGIVARLVGLADTVRIDEIRGYEIIETHRTGVADGNQVGK
jgi:hypothetical protein